MPNTLISPEINGLSDHDILTRLYQKILDHLQADAESKKEIRERLEDHENRICQLEGSQIKEEAQESLMGQIWRVVNQPVTAFVLMALLMAYLHITGGKV